jgi:hypothetical protein
VACYRVTFIYIYGYRKTKFYCWLFALNVNAVQIVHKGGKENKKKSIKNYQNFVFQFHDKGNLFLETLAFAHRTQFECYK